MKQNQDLGYFICTDESCTEDQKVFQSVGGMFAHKGHTVLKSLADIRQDINKNSVIINTFLCQHDLKTQLEGIDKFKRIFFKDSHININEFLAKVKSKLIVDTIETQRLVEIINSILTDNHCVLDQIKGDFSILKDIQDLPNKYKILEKPYTQAIHDIKELMKKINQYFINKNKKSVFKTEVLQNFSWGNQVPESMLYIKTVEVGKNGLKSEDLKNGDKYIGNYVKGKMEGQGSYFDLNGDTYKGEWKNDLKHGEGEQVFFNGDKYNGSCVQGRMDGYGEYLFENGEIYKGQFQNDLKHGKGEFFFSNGNRYQGNYKQSQKDGYGEFFWANGDVYKGSWYNDKREGEGYTIFENGKKRLDQWVNGRIQVPVKVNTKGKGRGIAKVK